MTRHLGAAWLRARRARVPLIVAGAAMLLAGCVVPIPIPIAAQRSGSMLASDATCPADASLGGRFRQPLDAAQVDAGLITEALRQLVNEARCQQGATPLALSPPAMQAAQEHARSMARHDFMSHTSPVRGRETLPKRIRAERGRFGYAAENVARGATTRLDADGCLGPGVAGTGAPTYADVARGLFALWIDSEGHRDNILNPNYRQVGAGLGVNPQKYQCGEIAAAMVFIG